MSTTEEELRQRFGTTDFEQDLLDQDTRDRLEYGNQDLPDPTRSARILNVAGRTGLPYEIISAGESLESLESSIDQQDFDAEKWLDESPEFARFASKNPYALSVLKRDQEHLTWFEREWMRPWQLGIAHTTSQVQLNLIQDRRARGREYWLDTDEKRIETLKGTIQEHDFGATGAARPLIWMAKNLGPMAYTVASGLDEAFIGAVAGTIAGSKLGGLGGTAVAPGPGTAFGITAGGVAGFFSGGGIGLTVGGAEGSFKMMRGEQYGRFIDAGFSHEEAARISTITGAISAVPEIAGIGKMLRGIPVVDNMVNWGADKVAAHIATDLLARQSVALMTRRLATRYTTNLGWEITTEIVQDTTATLGQNYLAATNGRPDAHVDWDEWMSDMENTVVETAKGVLIIGAVGPGMAYTQDLQRAKRSRTNELGFRALADAIEGSTTRTEAPETYRAFVEAVTKNQGQILVNANRLDELWQSENADPDEMAGRLGIDIEELELAREADHDIEIPAVAFAEQLAPSALFDKLLPDLKFHEKDMSPREREIFDKNKPRIIQDIEASLEKLQEAEDAVEVENIMRDVGGQLIAAQMEENTAGHLAQLYRGFGVIGEKLGMDPTELFEKFFGGVRRVTPEALLRSEVLDPELDPIINRLRRQDWPTQRQTQGASLMDLIDEAGGIDPTDPELSARDFELTALEFGVSKAKLKRWTESGRTLADLAEMAHEQGFILENDENVLLEALDREGSGTPVFGDQDQGQPGMRTLSDQMEQIERMIDELGIDIADFSNEEVRGLLEAADTYDQELTGAELRATLEAVIAAESKIDNFNAEEIDTLLAKAEALFPLIYQEQNFGDLQLTDIKTRESTGNVVEITEDAQVKYDRVVRRKKAMKALLDCVSG